MMVKSDLGKKGGTPFFASIPNNCVTGAAAGKSISLRGEAVLRYQGVVRERTDHDGR